MARILFTGNRGFLGTRFQARYDREHTVLGIDKDDVDILDKPAVERTFREFKPELVYHAAAITSTDFSNAHPDLTRRINVEGAVNVAEAARDVGAKLIFLSTEQVFNGNDRGGPYTEEDQPKPNTMYGTTKLEAEGKVKSIIEDLWILRFTWLFGLPERNMPVNPNILWNAVQIAGGGRKTPVARYEFRGHTYGHDMIDAIMKVPEIPYGTYHIGSSNDLDRYDVTVHALKELGLEDRIEALIEPDEAKYGVSPRDVRLDTSKLAAQGITFEDTGEAISRALSEFGLRGAFSA